MKTSVIRTLTILIAVCILINVFYQVYVKISSPYETDVALSYTINQTLDAEGLIFKDETVISSDASGVVQYLYKNGTKVAKQANVAMTYQNQKDVAATEQIKTIDNEIKSLMEVQSPGAMVDTDISVVDKQLTNEYYKLIEDIAHNQLTNIAEEKVTLTMLFNKRQIITGKVQNFNDSIAQLNQQKQELTNSISSRPQSVVSPSSGYFVDSTDGLEGTLSLDYANTVTAADLQTLIDNQKEAEDNNIDNSVPNSIGKVISKPTIYYVTLVPSNSLTTLTPGKTCSLHLSKLDGPISATIEQIKLDKNQDKSIVIFSTDIMNESFASLRYDIAEAVLNSYTGLRIPKSAVRTNDQGEMGVYVTNSASMKFKKIDNIFENEEYILSKPHADDSSYLQLYDTMIVQGKDLYDNKPM